MEARLRGRSGELGQFLLDRDGVGEGLACLGRARDHAEVVRQSIPDNIDNLTTLSSVHRGIGKALGRQGIRRRDWSR